MDQKVHAFSKILYPDEGSSSVAIKAMTNAVNPSLNVENIFDNQNDRLDVFKTEDISKLMERCLLQWTTWDKNAAEFVFVESV